MIAHFLNRTLFPTRQFYAPIDADALQQYPVFGKLGFYGVNMDTTSGAATAVFSGDDGGVAWWIFLAAAVGLVATAGMGGIAFIRLRKAGSKPA